MSGDGWAVSCPPQAPRGPPYEVVGRPRSRSRSEVARLDARTCRVEGVRQRAEATPEARHLGPTLVPGFRVAHFRACTDPGEPATKAALCSAHRCGTAPLR